MPIRRFSNRVFTRLWRQAARNSSAFGLTATAVKRVKGDIWNSTSRDPQFLFPAPHGVTSITFFVACERFGALSPRFYFDWGKGLNESETIGFTAGRAALIRLNLEGCEELVRLRFDPCEEKAVFTFRWGANADGDALSKEVEAVLAALEEENASVLRADFNVAKMGPAAAFGPHGVGSELVEGDVWRTTGRDPQVVFPKPRGVSRLSIFLSGERDGSLTPRVYLNWGEGFHQLESICFSPARAALIELDLGGCADLSGLRLDPHEAWSDFNFRWATDNECETLALDVEPQLSALEASGAAISRSTVAIIDYAPASDDRPVGAKRTPRTPHEHFLYACALAGRELGKPSPPPSTPLISFVSPVFNTPPNYLDDLIASFRRQAPGWSELILSDDGSTSALTAKWLEAHAHEPGLVVLRNGVNQGIAVASNAGAAVARGRWIGFVDHDDALADHAVAVLARAIAEAPQARFFYTDEAIADAQMHVYDFFDKPAFDDVLLSGVNYINHISLYARDLFEDAGGFREGFDGSQDYDLLLRALGRLRRDEIRHVPYAAYVWRRDGRSYSVKFLEKATQNARRALSEAYKSKDKYPTVERAILADLHRVRFAAPRPKVSIVVPNRDSFRLMRTLTEGLFRRTDFTDFELIVVDNGTTDPQMLDLYRRLASRSNFTLDMEPASFNFARQVNRGARSAKGDAILLLNNDIEVIEPGWLAEMVECLAYEDVGVVGARLLYPTGEIQHAGVAIGMGSVAGHWFLGRPADYEGPYGRLAVRSTMSAVTGACMLISRACFDATGGFDEEAFAVAFNDVDFCLRARLLGYRTVYTPFAKLIHHESVSRGPDNRGPNLPRFLREQATMIERHETQTYLDPVLSPWRDRNTSEPFRIVIEELPKSR